MPTTDSEAAVMSGQFPTEVQSQDQPMDDMVDLQIITKAEYERQRVRKFVKYLRASKRLGKTVQKQKTKIESLEIKVDVLEEQLGDANQYQQDCGRELKDAQAQLATTKKALQASNARWTRQNGTVKGLRTDLKESKAYVRNEQAINRDLKDRFAASQEELSRCKDDLFSLQPMAQVADSSIVRELEIVSQEVVHWIEAEVAAFGKAHPKAEPEHIFSFGNSKDAAIFLQHHPAAGEHLARYLVHRFFKANLFGKRFYFLGLTEEIAKILQKAEESMGKFDPPRDSASIATWRSETLQALAATEECQQLRTKQLQNMNSQLFQELGRTFPILFARSDSMTRFYQQVLKPAAKVATTIRTSISTYTYSMADSPFCNWNLLGLKHMKTHKMLDVKNGSYLKPNAAVVADEQGTIGKFIIPLEPGLYRTRKGKDETTLRLEIYLVELNHPVAKRSQGSA